jgi:NDP-sugar pyrophosphorylase family protein
MVLAAGLGERMRPLTLVRAKPVLPVLNRPLLHWTLEQLARNGVRDVVVNLHHLPSTVRRAVGDGRSLGVRVRYSNEPRILGTGGGPRRVRRFFGDGPAVIVNGDVLFDFDLRALLRAHRESGAAATLALLPNPDVARYSAVTLSRAGWVTSFGGRPHSGSGRAWLFTGVQVIDPVILERLPAGPSHSVSDLYIPILREGGRIRGVPMSGTWYDFGGPELYLRSQLSFLARGFRALRPARRRVHADARVAPDAVVERSVIGPGCVIGPRASVLDSVLWDRVRVGAGARVERSILASGARIAAGDVREGAIIVPFRGKVVVDGIRA